jgi:hypothetical protein
LSGDDVRLRHVEVIFFTVSGMVPAEGLESSPLALRMLAASL